MSSSFLTPSADISKCFLYIILQNAYGEIAAIQASEIAKIQNWKSLSVTRTLTRDKDYKTVIGEMPAKVLQKRLGHKDIQTTLNTYCDIYEAFEQ